MRWAVVLSVLSVLVAGCATAGPTPDPRLTPAPAPAGWTFKGWTEPGLELAVPAGWEIATDFQPSDAPTPDPSAGPKLASVSKEIIGIQKQGGYRANIGGQIETPLGNAGPGYVEVLVTSDEGMTLSSLADHWATVAAPLRHERKPDVVLPAGPAAVFEVDDMYEGEDAFMIRARWYLFVLPDGRGMNVAVGTYADPAGGNDAASMETLRTFADRVIATLRPTAGE